MQLASLQRVNSLVAERDCLASTRAAIELDQMHVVIAGKYQDDAIVAVVRAVLRREVDARVSRIDAALRKLGVDPV